jgi:hypothetical protein
MADELALAGQPLTNHLYYCWTWPGVW